MRRAAQPRWELQGLVWCCIIRILMPHRGLPRTLHLALARLPNLSHVNILGRPLSFS